jgi:hypothetical protein
VKNKEYDECIINDKNNIDISINWDDNVNDRKNNVA